MSFRIISFCIKFDISYWILVAERDSSHPRFKNINESNLELWLFFPPVDCCSILIVSPFTSVQVAEPLPVLHRHDIQIDAN